MDIDKSIANLIEIHELKRRKFLKNAALLGFGFSVGGAPAVMQLALADVRGDGTPMQGGTLRVRQIGDPPNLDTLAQTTSRVPVVVGPCGNGLLRYDTWDPEKIVPDLAESYELSEDGHAYTFRIHQGVKFHDGKPCTAEDVKFTFDTIRNPPSGYVSVRKGVFDSVRSIDILDPYTVRFNLSRPSPSLIPNIASAWMLVLPKHILEKGPMTDTIVGTGPFKLKEWKRGVSLELERNPEYFKQGLPHLDRIIHYFIPDDNTAYAYFRTGQVDAMAAYTQQVDEWAEGLADQAYVISNGPSQAQAVAFNVDKKPWNDVRVRQAAALAINREEYLKTVLRGKAIAFGRTPPGQWALPKEDIERIPGYAPYSDKNIEKAKVLLTEAGFSDGFKDKLIVRRTPAFEPLAIFIQAQLKKIGIDLTLDLQETASYVRSRQNGRWSIDVVGATSAVNDPDSIYGSALCGDPNNFTHFCDPEIDTLFKEQSQTIDRDKRRDLVRKLETRYLSQYPIYMLGYYEQFKIFRNNLHGWVVHPNEDNGTRFEDVWLENT